MFLKRVLRRLVYEKRKIEYKLHGKISIVELNSYLPSEMNLDDYARVLPGNNMMMPWYSKETQVLWKRKNQRDLFSELCAHRLRIFSSHPYDISSGFKNRSDLFYQYVSELPKSMVNEYRQINWHRDFRSDYQWPSTYWYFDKRLAPRAGSDVKIPWELSRFVHVGILAHGEIEQGGHEFILQVMDWIANNDRFRGVNWSSELVVALRAINWIWGLHLFKPIISRYPKVLRIVSESLFDHRVYLQRNLAFHELYTDDHYLADLVGILYICAAFPEFPDSDEWCLFALKGIESEMTIQVLDDGYSGMMSSSYHRFVVELFLSGAALSERLPHHRVNRLLNTTSASAWPYVNYRDLELSLVPGEQVFSGSFYKKLHKMASITMEITKPNGLVPQFGDNDSARVHRFFDSLDHDGRDHRHLLATVGWLLGDEIYKKYGEEFTLEADLICGNAVPSVCYFGISEYGVGDGFNMFPDSGIAVYKSASLYLSVICTPNGYRDGKGGHAHNDKLSFELNVNGVDLIVDGGCPFYTSHPELRNNFRSTSSHNTLSILGVEQDPFVDDLFSLPQSSSPELEKISDNIVIGRHYGYGCMHQRRFEVSDNGLTIEDELSVDKACYIQFNLDPLVFPEIVSCSNGSSMARLAAPGDLCVCIEVVGAGNVEITDGFFGVGYGKQVDNRMLIFEISPDVDKVLTNIVIVDCEFN